MLNISKDLAPPLEMVAPYFKIGSFFYLISSILLLFIDSNSSHQDIHIIAWIHMFLLGFIMMIIFGAMAQLIPVVVEVGHYLVDTYLYILPLLATGTIAMVVGFLYLPMVLPFGGAIVLIAMIIFLYDALMTLLKVERISLTVKMVALSNIFLLAGIISGFIMSLSIGNGVAVDLEMWLGVHAFLVLGGYVTLTIMGLSLILLPMFGLSHGFDESYIKWAFILMVIGILLFLAGSFLQHNIPKLLSLIIIFVSIGLYLYQVYIIYKTRARKVNDVWVYSMFFGYASLALVLLLGIAYFTFQSEALLFGTVWFLIMGFFSFLIIGHLYKIVPFLVWFKHYSPLAGKERVPMLNEMYPKEIAKYQFISSMIGVIVSGFGIVISNIIVFKCGVIFIILGAILLLYSVIWMMNFPKNTKVKNV